ncbi:uncharacterized protein A1O9_02745 [Exophiala aquamarina CBS 119918]|uniref:PH domain-containing protein n=1 Tax=Exophiala aquamarina CBS 119918 TaxID=1182545 RepID=A0A072PZV7_9EURO|nr:uncharacterized protein A1O9_02745 [Exophiala aquamarina CBS 119918]KEF61180.1 hypothetical protein A1O9_02745 [Exophiala aquamarina CBS 119918]
MATAVLEGGDHSINNGLHASTSGMIDPFVDHTPPEHASHAHRYSALVDPDAITLGASTSPSQVKRSLEAHIIETERRLHDTQKLGQSLLQQQADLQEKLLEVDQQQGDAEISPELRRRLADLEREHNDVGKEIARALLGPKSRAVSGEEKPGAEPSTLSSQATASPTKVTAPSRRQRNQPSNRAGDLQFAADISTSLLAQVRQLQSAVAERDDLLKQANADRDRLERESLVFTQRLRAHDENEQKYKDENWNLETQSHELMASAREANEREKKLRASLALALAEKTRSQTEMDELRLQHEKLAEDHAAAKKAHDTELHTLKRSIDVGESERGALQSKLDELTAQNQELAHAVAARLRGHDPDAENIIGNEHDEDFRDVEAPEDSPPPSPTKATPRHGGLESETLRSSLHHAHRMIQNLKNNIHREKTEKIELKRMLQDARDELEQRRGDGSLGSSSKRQKTKSETFKKPPHPNMLGGGRRTRTDVEFDDDDWEDHVADTPTHPSTQRFLAVPTQAEGRVTDVSDAYHTATENEGAFETADERHTTESEDFQTGAESLAGDSTDDLTETEETSSLSHRVKAPKGPRPSLSFRAMGDRQSYVSTASTSAGEEDEEDLKTPVVTQTHKFRLRNGRQSFGRQSRASTENTPTQLYSEGVSADSPATVTSERSPPAPEQSLFAELGGYEGGSNFGTPGRSSIASATSTPGLPAFTPSRQSTLGPSLLSRERVVLVDSGTMTEPWQPETTPSSQAVAVAVSTEERGTSAPPSPERITTPASLSPIDFPLPPTLPSSPIKHIDNGTQYTPQRNLQESPLRNAAFITPPKTVWDEAQSPEPTQGELERTVTAQIPRPLGYSNLLMHGTEPLSPERAPQPTPPSPERLTFSSIQSQVTKPVQTPSEPKANAITSMSTQVEDSPSRPSTAQKVGVTGLLASTAAVPGVDKSNESKAPAIMEDETSEQEQPAIRSDIRQRKPLSDVSGNSVPTKNMKPLESEKDSQNAIPALVSSSDQASQTLLTAEEIEKALQTKTRAMIPVLQDLPMRLPPPTEVTRPRELAPISTEGLDRDTVSAFSFPSPPIKRPSSASSQRLSSANSNHPPLPADHMEAIAKASSRVASPTREMNQSNQATTIMGPPAFPASAMRRPKTPGDSIRSPTRDSNTVRSSNVGRYNRGTVASQMSRRSSVSSFASEVDVRFNLPGNPQVSPHNFGTDPKIIQAITQTMIGEFLWKYTRKAGRAEMSETRHRRYFWVHPYTKTLYWSDQDPQTAGRNEMRAKSVLIESVQVINDDNPMPPGLHRKSIEVVTPGRRVRFTASTGQRHETWCNALKYLLVRNEEQNGERYTAGGNEITRDDVNEFSVNGAGYRASLARDGSRMSLSSYNSRTTRGSVVPGQNLAPGVAVSSSATRTPHDSTASRTAPSSVVRRSRADQAQDGDGDRTVRASSVSRFSRMIGSVTGRTPRASEAFTTPGGASSEGTSIYDASVVGDGRKDSAEELRREMLKQEQVGFGGLENVRACCDGKPTYLSYASVTNPKRSGKHDVSTLTHAHRHGSNSGHMHRGISMSMSLRGSARRSGAASAPAAQTPTKTGAS